MIIKTEASDLVGDGSIRVFYPGTKVSNTDTGIASIGRIDHAQFEGDTLISMHPHVNDEILTYVRSGHIEHLDSEGYTASLNKTHLMLMKAGKSFFHEEQIVDKGEPLTALQIFVRPAEKDLQPEVSFRTLEHATSDDKWRMIASPDEQSELRFSSKTWLYDMHCSAVGEFALPCELTDGKLGLLYVFNGEIEIKGGVRLRTQEAIIATNEAINFLANRQTDVVLFVTDQTAPSFAGGMFSGNQV